MKKRFKNILAKKRKKNGVAVLLCAIMLAVSLSTLVGFSIAKGNTEDGSGVLGTEDIQAENSRAGQQESSVQTAESRNPET